MERRAVCEDNSKLEKKANEMAGKVFILSSPKQARTAFLYTETLSSILHKFFSILTRLEI